LSRYVKIALFFTVLLSAGVVFIIMSSNGINYLNVNMYEVVLPDATGLSTRSKVYLAGVVVGKVRSIELTGNEARLHVEFQKDVEIRQNAMLTRRTNSILGTSTLALEPGTELTPIIPIGGIIGTAPVAGDMNAALGMVQDMGEQLNLIFTEFRTNQMALLAVSLETFNSIAQKIDANTEAQIDNIARILESAALITERTERLLRNGEGEINGSVTDIREALANIRIITGDIAAGQGNLGQALYDERLYESILATAEQTESVAVKLSEALDNISTLAKTTDVVVTDAGEIVRKAIGLGISVDTNARYDIRAGTARAAASILLEPESNDRWYRVGVTSTPDGVISRTVKETTDISGNITAYEDTTETKYSIAVDAELARRIGIFTLRGGVFESTAGIGFDIQPLNWVSLSGEIFNFNSEEQHPNLRGTLTFYPFFDPNSNKPWNWIYIRGGINNALNGSRDFFIGGGLRFAGREVKGLVGLVPVF
jgi:phospholipid/cholesterol/gamma-HCH transport system substrate-binding protein